MTSFGFNLPAYQQKLKGLWLPDPGRDLNSNIKATYFLGLATDKSHLKYDSGCGSRKGILAILVLRC